MGLLFKFMYNEANKDEILTILNFPTKFQEAINKEQLTHRLNINFHISEKKLIVWCEAFYNGNTAIKDITSVEPNKYNLHTLVKLFTTLKNYGASVIQADICLINSIESVRKILRDNSVGYTLRRRSQNNQWIAIKADQREEVLDQTWNMCYYTPYKNFEEETIWFRSSNYRFKLFLEPNKFKKDWKKKVSKALAEVLRQDFEARIGGQSDT